MLVEKYFEPDQYLAGMWYEDWLKEVDDCCFNLAGVSYKDLPDYDFAVNWEDGIAPEEMAVMMLREEGAL
jgi:hypothetical protein